MDSAQLGGCMSTLATSGFACAGRPLRDGRGAYMHMCTQAHIHMHVHIQIHTCTQTHTHARIYTYMCTDTHVHMHMWEPQSNRLTPAQQGPTPCLWLPVVGRVMECEGPGKASAHSALGIHVHPD